MLSFFARSPAARPAAQPARLVSSSSNAAKPVVMRPPFQREPVIAASVLRAMTPRLPIHVVDHSALTRASTKLAAGRSKGYKVKCQLSDESAQYFYYKLPFYRGGFVKELAVAALARKLLGEHAPMVYAVETPQASDSSQSQYALISQSLATNLHYDNLENWALQYEADDEEIKFSPRHMGLSLAFKLMLGDSDIKAANFVLLRDQQGYCYSIDHEYAFDHGPVFVRDAASAVRELNDYKSDAGNFYFLLRSKTALLDKMFPVLQRAVQRDIDDGSMLALYERFVNLTDEDIQALYDQYGSLINADERAFFTHELKFRQECAKEYIEQYQVEQKLITDFRASLRRTPTQPS